MVFSRSAATISSMSDHHIQLWMLAVQALAFVGLIWYCIETVRLRVAAREQIGESQKLIQAAMDQVEGLSKPCLTIASKLRDPSDATLDVVRAVASTEALGNEGNFIVENIGNGPALNVSYRFVANNETARTHIERGPRYVQNVLGGQKVRMVEPMTAYTGDFHVVFHYESIGGRRYETKLRMIHFALTDFEFGTRRAGSQQVEAV